MWPLLVFTGRLVIPKHSQKREKRKVHLLAFTPRQSCSEHRQLQQSRYASRALTPWQHNPSQGKRGQLLQGRDDAMLPAPHMDQFCGIKIGQVRPLRHKPTGKAWQQPQQTEVRLMSAVRAGGRSEQRGGQRAEP